MIRRLTPAALSLSMLIVSSAAAQPTSPGAGRPPALELEAQRAEMRVQHAEDLKVLLRLRPDQEPALDAFVAAMGPDGPPKRGEPPRARSTPERLQQMARIDAEMDARRNARREALARFYAALTPDQQKAFDAVGRLADGPRPGPGPLPSRMGGGPGDGAPRGG